MVNLEKVRRIVARTALESWEGEVAAEHLEQCRRILSDAGRRLLEGTAAEQADEVVGVLKQAVEALNVADEATHFIMTIEREDLCEHLGQLGAACGLSEAQIDAGLSGRDW